MILPIANSKLRINLMYEIDDLMNYAQSCIVTIAHW
jgi:hypothetical protein